MDYADLETMLQNTGLAMTGRLETAEVSREALTAESGEVIQDFVFYAFTTEEVLFANEIALSRLGAPIPKVGAPVHVAVPSSEAESVRALGDAANVLVFGSWFKAGDRYGIGAQGGAYGLFSIVDGRVYPLDPGRNSSIEMGADLTGVAREISSLGRAHNDVMEADEAKAQERSAVLSGVRDQSGIGPRVEIGLPTGAPFSIDSRQLVTVSETDGAQPYGWICGARLQGSPEVVCDLSYEVLFETQTLSPDRFYAITVIPANIATAKGPVSCEDNGCVVLVGSAGAGAVVETAIPTDGTAVAAVDHASPRAPGAVVVQNEELNVQLEPLGVSADGSSVKLVVLTEESHGRPYVAVPCSGAVGDASSCDVASAVSLVRTDGTRYIAIVAVPDECPNCRLAVADASDPTRNSSTPVD